jgi:transposase
MEETDPLQSRYRLLGEHLDERTKRLWLAAEAISYGKGGISHVSRATGVARNTISRGCRELREMPEDEESPQSKRIRKEGGGRKPLVESDESLINDLEALIEPTTRGDPENPLLWTTKSLRNIADELQQKGHQVSYRTIGSLLHNLGYSLQANRKVHEGASHVDRNAQFEHINRVSRGYMSAGQPVISIDAKKKELIGNSKNNGKEWHTSGKPETVNVYDFPSMYGKATPYGIYDIANDVGWVNVGISCDTASFAVESIRRWWRSIGMSMYPNAHSLLITADCGGSNGYRVRLWKTELQNFANEENLTIQVCHLPPGTSKWNKIEHRLFSFISINWRGRPLISYEVIVNTISSTKTKQGLKVHAVLDENVYLRGIKVSDEAMKNINLKRDEFHGDWNYSILPKNV